MSAYVWPDEAGWPYPDAERELADTSGDVDDDALLLRAVPAHLFDRLEPLERQVIAAHYGLDGGTARSMKQLHHEMGLSRADLREALAGGLAKLRISLAE
jgi:DNA-directed RNA polymerase sigma subunit (sigma70/sigma32)